MNGHVKDKTPVTITSEAAAEIAATRSAMHICGRMLLGSLLFLLHAYIRLYFVRYITSVSLIIGFSTLNVFPPAFIPLC